MTFQTALLYNQQKFGYVPHTSVSGETWQKIKTGTTSGAGNAGGTTLVDSGFASASANTYNGAYWIHILSGTCKGQWQRIVDDDGSGTYTLEGTGFTAQIGSAVEYEMWLSPEPVINVDSSSGATNIVDATRSEPNVNSVGYWIGYWVVVISGTYAGQKAQITAFVPGTGTFTVGSGLGGALSAGDVCLIRKYVDIGSVSFGLTESYERRPMKHADWTVGDGFVGQRGGTFGFNTQITASGSLAAAASGATGSVLSGLFGGCGFDETIGTSMVISGGGSTAGTIDVATGTWERVVRPGTLVIYKGEPRIVTGIADGGGGVDTLTVAPDFTIDPIAGETVYATRMYSKNITGTTYGVCLEWTTDGIRTTMTGCKGNVVLNSAAVPELAWSFNVDHWMREGGVSDAPLASSAYTTAAPVQEHERVAYVERGAVYTATNIGQFTATLGAEVQPKAVQGACGVNGRSGYQITNVVGGGSFRQLITSTTGELVADDDFLQRNDFGLFVYYGSHGNMFAFRAPECKLVESPHPADANGMIDQPYVFEAMDAGYANDAATPVVSWKVPDFAFYLS